MVSIREAAQAYEPAQTKNISELPEIHLDNVQLERKTFKQGTPDEFSMDVFTYNNEEYRMPASVLAQIKEILAEKTFTLFKVKKSGEGMNTKYTVITLD